MSAELVYFEYILEVISSTALAVKNVSVLTLMVQELIRLILCITGVLKFPVYSVCSRDHCSLLAHTYEPNLWDCSNILDLSVTDRQSYSSIFLSTVRTQ